MDWSKCYLCQCMQALYKLCSKQEARQEIWSASTEAHSENHSVAHLMCRPGRSLQIWEREEARNIYRISLHDDDRPCNGILRHIGYRPKDSRCNSQLVGNPLALSISLTYGNYYGQGIRVCCRSSRHSQKRMWFCQKDNYQQKSAIEFNN